MKAKNRALVAMAVAAIGLLGCKEKQDAGQGAGAAAADRAREAAEQHIRAAVEAADQARFRGVQVYGQAIRDREAVCGQVNPFASDPGLFVPFVSVVTIRDDQGKAPQYEFDQHVGTTTAEASRVYMAIVRFCYDKGGPMPGPAPGAMPVPPLPDAVRDPLPDKGTTGPPASAALPPAPQPASQRPGQPAQADATPASSETSAVASVTMRQNANLHTELPHGPVARVVPAGTVMRVFGEAPGGWYQVGDTAPWGWVHESMLARP